MKRETKFNLKALFILAALMISFTAMAQKEVPAGADDPDNNAQGTVPETRAVGDVLFTFVPGLTGTPVGLEAQPGGGGFWGTDIGPATIGTMALDGTLTFSFSPVGNPIGVTATNSTVWQTDTTGDQVISYTTAGAMTGSFPVAAQTTFPEGITFNGTNLFVVNGSGGANVLEYTTAGALVNTFPVLGSSQDGIAWDGNGFWMYDSGTDTVRHYDTSFNQTESFSGTIAAGFSGGEGVAYLDGIVYVVATGSDLVVAFDGGVTVIPTLSEIGLAALIGVMLLASLAVMRRKRMQTA